MATRVIDDTKLQNIAVAIQGKDSGGTMTVDEMPARIAAIQTGDEVLFSSKGRQYTRTVEIPDGVTTLGEYAFGGCTGLTNITLPNSLTAIDSNAFGGCTGLTEIDLKNVTTLSGVLHFQNCSSLRKVIGKKVTSTTNSFYFCKVLQTAILSNVSKIGQNTFLAAYALKNVDCRNADRIVQGAFGHCSRLNLIDLTSRATPTTLDNANAFNDTNNTWIAVVANDTIKSDFQSATNWSTFASHFRTIAEVEAEVGMTYDEYYYQLFGEPRNEVAA
jgi:hypothetical protein